MPSEEVETLKLDDARIGVFKVQWTKLSTDGTGDETKDKVDVEVDMYSITLVIRKDLDMRAGKVGTQCTHAALGACYQKLDSKKVKAFMKASNSRRAVTLKVNNLAELEVIRDQALAAGLNVYVQVDAGLTQVEPNTATVLAIGPDDPERIHAVTEKLKLY
jgi:peptidyl-tRNA hydrolase